MANVKDRRKHTEPEDDSDADLEDAADVDFEGDSDSPVDDDLDAEQDDSGSEPECDFNSDVEDDADRSEDEDRRWRRQKRAFQIVEVKEKFGLLRVCCSPTTVETQGAIFQAEKESRRTCELCGRPGCLREDGGRLRVRCESCEPSQ